MPFRHISEDIKERAMALADDGFARDHILEVLNISRSSFYQWKANRRDHGSVVPPPSYARGRPRLIPPAVSEELYALLREDPTLYLDEIQEWLIIAHDIGIGKTALNDHLHDIGLSYKRLHKIAAERDQVAWEAFHQHARENWVASQLVFVDETSADDRTIYRHYGRSVIGTAADVSQPFRRGDRWSIVAALTVDGYINMRAVQGSVDGGLFLEFIIEDVVSVLSS